MKEVEGGKNIDHRTNSCVLSQRTLELFPNDANKFPLSRTCSRSGTVLALRYFACRNRKAAMRQEFSSHQSFGGWESPGDAMYSLI